MNITANAPGSTAFQVNNIRGGTARMDLASEWMSRPQDQRYLSLTALAAATKSRYLASVEDRCDMRDFEFIAPEIESKEELYKLHQLSVGMRDGKERFFTNWTFGQTCTLAGAPSGYLRTLPSQLVAENLTWGLRHNRSAELIKTYANGDELMAVTGPDYGRIPDYEVVEAIQQIAGDGLGGERWKVPGVMDWRTMVYDPEVPVTVDTTTLYASDRDVFIFLVDDRNQIEIGRLPNGEPDLVFRGFYVKNSEVGNGALKIAVFYLRGVCCNRIMWGVEDFEEITMVHSKLAPSRFVAQSAPALRSFADGSVKKLIDGVAKAKEAKVATDQDEAVAFLQARNFSKKRASDILAIVEKEEGRPARTVWDFTQGITAFARTIPNNDDRVNVENVARKVLDKVA